MRLNKILVSIVLCFAFGINLNAIKLNNQGLQKEEISININDLELEEFIRITSQIIGKNILITENVKGKVNFISNKPMYIDDILNILIYTLEAKGYTIIENSGILRVIKLSDAAKYNMPVYSNSNDPKTYQVITEVFNVEYSNVDYVSSKIRHLISKTAKLVTDKVSNAIVITDFPENIKTVKEVISMIAKDSKKYIEIVALKNLQGASIINDLKSVAKTVFDEKIEKEKVEILLNKDTNAIMFVGKKANVGFLVSYLQDIEKKGSLVEKVVEVVYLRNAEAKNVITILTSIIDKKIYKDKEDKPFASTNEESNSIILMGPKEEIKYFTQLIEKLDVDKQQVYVQARIIEVSEKKTRDVGVRYGLSGTKQYSSGLASFSASLSENSIMPSIPLISTADDTVGEVINKDVLAMGVSLNLLNQNGAADIVSEPSLLCINNKESSIYVGQTLSIKASTTNGNTSTESYNREDIGLTLKVKPRISTGDKVLLEISTKLEDVGQTTTNNQPDTSKKELLTSAIVNNGESVILGGYIKAKRENTEDKVPFFGDIPLIGALFRNNRSIDDKINLVIIITPYIVPKSKDLTYVRNQLAELKMLENKYTKDVQVRLEKMKLKASQEDLQREQEKIILDEQKTELKEDMIDFSEDKKDYEDEKLEDAKEELDEDEKLHRQRVKEMFGI